MLTSNKQTATRNQQQAASNEQPAIMSPNPTKEDLTRLTEKVRCAG
ncbi:MAG: hypothetical protein ONB46_14785 [candidate division KSB1 bacterium]|nr:hypothetical protein [candidate division KSB1 bacterium]MDZ7367043.1 hypothetical protein [candidate division KSB1 bacterium]MDZ7406743.1 hypothetical protein [candidate division KSB1 bacterium]